MAPTLSTDMAFKASLPVRSIVMHGGIARLREMHDDLDVRDFEGNWIAIAALNVTIDAATAALEDIADLVAAMDPAERHCAAFARVFAEIRGDDTSIEGCLKHLRMGIEKIDRKVLTAETIEFFERLHESVRAFELAVQNETPFLERLTTIINNDQQRTSVAEDGRSAVLAILGEFRARLRQSHDTSLPEELQSVLDSALNPTMSTATLIDQAFQGVRTWLFSPQQDTRATPTLDNP